ncbi:hypothetical protein HD806DRAFT_534956 [Xylariaceae sp. AK1471]|nr:hypothetical protein HD806DRAFT_534956 [Xylariaceae sp. AK1471]
MASASFSFFSRLPAELRRDIWLNHYCNHYLRKHINVLRHVPQSSNELAVLPDGAMLFQCTVLDADTNEILHHTDLLPFPSREAYESHAWLLINRPQDISTPAGLIARRQPVDLTLCVYCCGKGGRRPLPDLYSDWRIYGPSSKVSTYRGEEKLVQCKTAGAPPIHVNWAEDLLYLAGPYTEHALWALTNEPWGSQVRHLAMEVPMRILTSNATYFIQSARNSPLRPLREFDLWRPQQMNALKTFRVVLVPKPKEGMNSEELPTDKFGFASFQEYLRHGGKPSMEQMSLIRTGISMRAYFPGVDIRKVVDIDCLSSSDAEEYRRVAYAQWQHDPLANGRPI